MSTKAFLLAVGVATVSLAGTALAQPSPDQGPPPGYNGPPPGSDQGGNQGPPPGYNGGPPPGYNGGPPPGYNGGPPQGGAMMGPGGQQHHSLRDRFAAANTTGDGRLTQQQAQAGGMQGVAAHFAQIDRDNKGYVTLQDIHMWYASRRANAGGGMQGPPPGGYGGGMQGGPPPGYNGGGMQGPPPGGDQGPPPGQPQ